MPVFAPAIVNNGTEFSMPLIDGISGNVVKTNGAGQWSIAVVTAGEVSGLGTVATHSYTEFVLTTSLGAANGTATLDSGGKVPLSQIPASVQGGMNYVGTWNANTNTPTLVSGVGVKGAFYKTSVAGSTSIDGINQWNVGDSIVFDGTTWDKIDGIANGVVAVFGRFGTVVAATGDYVVGQITGAAPLASPALTGTPTAPTAATATNTTQLATTAFVQSNVTLYLSLTGGTLTGALTLTSATASGPIVNSYSPVVSSSTLSLTGTILSGGTGITNLPHLLIQPTGTTAATGWSTTGTALGINTPTIGMYIDCRTLGTSYFSVGNGGTITTQSNVQASGFVQCTRVILSSNNIYGDSSGVIRLTDATGNTFTSLKLGTDTIIPSAISIIGGGVSAGTANISAPNFTIDAPVGTGTGAGGSIIFRTAAASSTPSSVRNSLVTAMTIDSVQDVTAANGNVKIGAVGKGLYIKEGTNATSGTATLAAGSVVVSTTKVTANSRIQLTINGGTLTNVGTPYISARTAGTSFTISSMNVLDTSSVAWVIVEPA